MTKRRKIAGVVALLAGVGMFAVAATVSAREPSLTRTWDEDVRVLATVDTAPDGAIRLDPVRRWRYTQEEVVSKEYRPATYRPEDALALWLYEQEIGLNGLIAHTFLVFEFPEAYGENRWLGLSVETRREVGETYSILRGMLRGFEVTHIWAVEEDLVRRRVEYLDYPLTRYRVTIEPDQVAALFRQFTAETQSLSVTPRWYNTVATNCTSSLIQYVNEVQEGAIPGHWSSVLTGRADDYLVKLGYVDPDSAQPITRDWLAAHPLR